MRRRSSRPISWHEPTLTLNVTVINTAERAIGVSPQVSIIPRPHKHVRVPLVLQLNSPMTNQNLQRSIRTGIVKIHVGSALEMTFRGALRRSLRSDTIVDPRSSLAAVRTALTKSVSAVLEEISCCDLPHSSAEGVNEGCELIRPAQR